MFLSSENLTLSNIVSSKDLKEILTTKLEFDNSRATMEPAAAATKNNHRHILSPTRKEVGPAVLNSAFGKASIGKFSTTQQQSTPPAGSLSFGKAAATSGFTTKPVGDAKLVGQPFVMQPTSGVGLLQQQPIRGLSKPVGSVAPPSASTSKTQPGLFPATDGSDARKSSTTTGFVFGQPQPLGTAGSAFSFSDLKKSSASAEKSTFSFGGAAFTPPSFASLTKMSTVTCLQLSQIESLLRNIIISHYQFVLSCSEIAHGSKQGISSTTGQFLFGKPVQATGTTAFGHLENVSSVRGTTALFL